MWMYVLFDLPVLTKAQRHEATKFRQFLLDDGFSMCQYSVYSRLLSGKEAMETHIERIKSALPKSGKVDIVAITDKQYENIISFSGRDVDRTRKKQPEQLLLF